MIEPYSKEINIVLEELKYRSYELWTSSRSYHKRGLFLLQFPNVNTLVCLSQIQMIFVPENKMHCLNIDPKQLQLFEMYDSKKFFVVYIIITIDTQLKKINKDDSITQLFVIGKNAYRTIEPIYDEYNRELTGKMEDKNVNYNEHLFETNNTCNNCEQIVKKLKKCGGCLSVMYCTKSCQQKSWSKHMFDCGKYATEYKRAKKYLETYSNRFKVRYI
jgi:hypothetical protein